MSVDYTARSAYGAAPGSAGAGIAHPGFAPGQPPQRSLRRIMFASQKGGVGKTASAVNVAACLGLSGYRTLIVDTDPIGSVAACFGSMTAPGHPGLYGLEQWELADLVVPEVSLNLDLLPYADDRRSIDLTAVHRSLGRLKDPAASEYDFVVIDTRPSVADMTRRLCQVVDEVVVVFQCHPLAYRTLGGILGQLRDARSDGANARLLGLLLTMVDYNDPMQVQLEQHIRGNLGQALFPISIPQDPSVQEGLMADRPAVIHEPECPAAQAYSELTQALIAAAVAAN
jgi:chromosome partitioning protein